MAISYLTQHIRTRPDEDDFSDEMNGSSAGVSSANDDIRNFEENSTEEDRDITPEAEEKEEEDDDSDEVSSCNFLLPSLSFLCKQNSNLLMRI